MRCFVQVPPTYPGFVMLAELGRGTTGAVYEVLDTALNNRRVALKIPVFSPNADQWEKRQRFLRECQVLAVLTSKPGSNIPALHMVGEHHGLLFSVREFVDGRTLAQRAIESSLELR